jgi:5-methylcytosine-specific restriction endonuclease McrA
MPWTTSTRRQRLPRDWPAIRQAILDRDHHRCQHVRADTGLKCGLPATDVDHIHPGDDHRPVNLQALCSWHHARKSAAEGNEAKTKAKPPPSPHPGLAG